MYIYIPCFLYFTHLLEIVLRLDKHVDFYEQQRVMIICHLLYFTGHFESIPNSNKHGKA